MTTGYTSPLYRTTRLINVNANELELLIIEKTTPLSPKRGTKGFLFERKEGHRQTIQDGAENEI